MSSHQSQPEQTGLQILSDESATVRGQQDRCVLTSAASNLKKVLCQKAEALCMMIHYDYLYYMIDEQPHHDAHTQQTNYFACLNLFYPLL